MDWVVVLVYLSVRPDLVKANNQLADGRFQARQKAFEYLADRPIALPLVHRGLGHKDAEVHDRSAKLLRLWFYEVLKTQYDEMRETAWQFVAPGAHYVKPGGGFGIPVAPKPK